MESYCLDSIVSFFLSHSVIWTILILPMKNLNYLRWKCKSPYFKFCLLTPKPMFYSASFTAVCNQLTDEYRLRGAETWNSFIFFFPHEYQYLCSDKSSFPYKVLGSHGHILSELYGFVNIVYYQNRDFDF